MAVNSLKAENQPAVKQTRWPEKFPAGSGKRLSINTHTHAKTLPYATCREEEIRRAAFACFSRFELNKKVRLIGIRVSGLLR